MREARTVPRLRRPAWTNIPQLPYILRDKKIQGWRREDGEQDEEQEKEDKGETLMRNRIERRTRA